MNDPSSEQRPAVSPLLRPLKDTSTLKQLWLREKRRESPFNEYRLNGIPESLKTFVDQFLKEYGVIVSDRLIWTSENSFVRVGGDWPRDYLPGVYQNYRFGLRLNSGSQNHWLYIHSTTLENAMSCLNFLVGLHDDHYERMILTHLDEDGNSGPQLCPLTSILLEKIILQNAKRKNWFRDTTFTPDQSRTLATSGTRTDIGLDHCKFEDDGEALLEALAARKDPETGLAKLTIQKSLPFAEGIMVLLLHMIKCLSLHYIHLESEEVCRAVAEGELQCLELDHCKLSDGGASLVESIREGRGPKGLDLYTPRYYDSEAWHPFDSSERFISFLNALTGNTYLERLDLSPFNLREEGILAAFAAALFENKGLFHLSLPGCRLNKSFFCELLRAISTHPSLQMLDLAYTSIDMDVTEATKAVAEMLSVNEQLEEIRIKAFVSFESLAWDALVTPRLECNFYRKRFSAIQEIRPLSTRTAVLASALAHVSNKPSPAFMLLRENGDILASYSRVESQSETSSRKRSHSPSSGGMVVSNVWPP
jgi:hypothetical protein